METLKALRGKYASQLKSVEEELQATEQSISRLSIQKEQLKGAIFALDQLHASDAAAKQVEAQPEVNQEEVNQEEVKTEETEEVSQ